MRKLPLFCLLLVTAACSSPHITKGTSRSGTSGTDEDGGYSLDEDGGGGVLRGNDSGGVTNTNNCSDESKLVYVVSHEGALYSFYPPTTTFKAIGQVSCPTGGAAPFSMAVDRIGNAWVHYNDGSLYKVNTTDASCASVGYQPDQAGFHTFGMGFATADAKSDKDALYLSDYAGKGLGVLDLATMKLRVIGPYSGALANHNSELTGTGDGRLFGFFTTLPAQLAEISKTSGAVSANEDVKDVITGPDWAFSFWGGDFYLYTAASGGGSLPMNATGSNVTRYRPSDKSVQVMKMNVGFRIVGAGVSTCAPTVPVPTK